MKPDASRHEPDSPAKRVSRSRAKALKSGARMVQVILRDPDAVRELDRLTEKHGTVTAAISAALTS